MKSIVKTLLAASLSIAAVSACSEEKLAPSTTGTKTTVHFGAVSSIVDNATKATLTTDDEMRFIGAWENGDEIGIQYAYVDLDMHDVTLGTWDKSKSKFSADIIDLTEGEGAQKMKYNASYPYSKSGYVDFGSNRTQVGALYNSKYDLMVADPITVTAKPGLDAEGKDIVFPMQRQTAIAYFHFTSDNTEAITKATLKVAGEGAAIAAKTVVLEPTGMSHENGLQEIILTTTDQNADDFTLWFNVLPTEYTSMSLTIETATKTLTINKSTSGSYVAGHLYKVVKAIPDDKWVSKETVYTTLAELNDAILAGKTEFKLNLVKPAVITRICSDNMTTYLQDETGGIMYYSKSKTPIVENATEGMTVSGIITGEATLYNDTHPEITSIVTDGATFGTTADIPCLNLTVAELNADFNKYLNAMVKLTGVEVSDAFSNSDTKGKVKQGEEELAVFVKSKDAFNIGSGSIGDIVLFPALYNTAQQAYFWAPSDFEATEIATVISVSSAITVKVGQTVDLGATTNSTASLKYVSDTPANVSVTEDGKITGVAEGTANVTISCDADGKFTAASKVVFVTVVAEDAPNKYFIKVTAEPTDWSGTYLIVYEAGNVAFNGSLTTLDAVNNTVTVEIIDNKIEGTDALLKSTFEIAKIGETINYSLKSASGYYIGRTATKNGMDTDQETVYNNAISFSNGKIEIKAGTVSSTLKFNDTSGQKRFRYYKTGQKDIQLYRLED